MRPALAELSPLDEKVAGTLHAASKATAQMRRGEEEVRVLSLAQVRSGCGVRSTAPCGGYLPPLRQPISGEGMNDHLVVNVAR